MCGRLQSTVGRSCGSNARELRTVANLQAAGIESGTRHNLVGNGPHPRRNTGTAGGLQRILLVLQFLDEHLDQHLSREELAEKLYLSPTRFHYVFKQAMGMAPMDYVHQLRLRRSQELLIGSDFPSVKLPSVSDLSIHFTSAACSNAAWGSVPWRIENQRRVR